MKKVIMICSIAAAASTAIGLKLGWPDDAQQRYYRAHNEVERIAFGKDGTQELRSAVTHERSAEKELYIDRDLGRRMIFVSAGFSGAILVLSVLAMNKNGRAESGSRE
jgi:hypothetical protein